MTLSVPHWAWARCEVRHSQQGWPAARLVFLENDGRKRRGRGFQFKWTVADGLSAGTKVDRALNGCKFSNVPDAVEWITRHEWARNVEMLREWDELYALKRASA